MERKYASRFDQGVLRWFGRYMMGLVLVNCEKGATTDAKAQVSSLWATR